ncbi:vWA domain-containing protein [Histidinibacterium aquaticum]|uniref:VWA domain-containing protein n=1 Tax=Histidinibacterium aquaticum TaxID=2613962 RepID=A0A5J5GSE1_9RHOB|nr:VWA domain-containing protein [Histidinibacterium aquaticum]KAA9010498.1 VWA domain-containing protein [Histidinibacterium aquaticum]
MIRPDEIDELKAAMEAETPSPDPARRAEDLARAREAFWALHREEPQGSGRPRRHILATALAGLRRGVTTMTTTLTSRGGLTATTAIVAGCLLVLTPGGRELIRPGLPVLTEDAAEPVAEIEEADTAVATESAPAPEAAGLSQAEAEAPPAPPPMPAPQSLMRTAPAEEAPPAMQGFGSPLGDDAFSAPMPELDTETFAEAKSSGVKVTVEEPVSTFSIDVDTASWSVIRSSLTSGRLPPPEAVRIEEMVNYFDYGYPGPGEAEAPFAVDLAAMETPWNDGTQLVRIGIQGRMPAVADRPPLNLVFLVDTSGSMNDPDKLPLLVQSLRLMLSELRPEDEVAVVTYAGSAGTVLEPTPARERETILQALETLQAGGSTNGAGGLSAAYDLAEEMSAEGEVSRVILATDGDFNVGLSDPSALEDFIARERESGTYLSVLGFGRGNLDDATMQALAQTGNGTAAYIDTLNEAQKVLVDQLSGALFPIADDVKIKVEWNPAEVAEYRLIGYETRALRREDFNNDAVDAGELGAGHSVTALYEVTPVGSPARLTDPLRYGAPEAASDGGELGFLRLRYKAPGEDGSQLIETPVRAGMEADEDARFAAAVAGFGELLRGSDYLGDWGYEEAIELASGARGEDAFGYRTEAVRLMRLAQSLSE